MGEMITMKRRSILINSIYNSLYNLLRIIFPLITIPYVSRILLADGLGKINYAVNIVNWFLIFASLGIPRYGVREIAKSKNTQKDLNTVFTELFIFNFISSIFCSVVYLGMILQFTYFQNRIMLYLVVGLQLFFNVFNVDWFYQGIEEYGYITRRSFFTKIISLVAMFIFVKTKDDLVMYALIQSLATVGNYFFNIIYLKKFVRFLYNIPNLSRHIKPIFILLSTTLATSIYSILDTTMLGAISGDKAVGYYSNVNKIMYTIATMTASLGGVMLPRLVQYYNDKKYDELCKLSETALKIILSICLPISLGLVLLAKQIVSVLFGQNFIPAVITIKIYAPFILFSTVGNLYGTQLLMTINKEKTLFYTTVIGAIVNFSLNIFLIKNFAQDGAAFASVVAELFVMLLQIYYVRKELKLNLNKRYIYSLIMSNVGIVFLIYSINFFVRNDILNLFISIIGSIFTYFIIGKILHNDTIEYIYGILSKHSITGRYR